MLVHIQICFHIILLNYVGMKFKIMRWVGHVACMETRKGACTVLVQRPERKRPLGRPRHRWEDDIKIDLQETGWGGNDCINRAKYRPGSRRTGMQI